MIVRLARGFRGKLSGEIHYPPGDYDTASGGMPEKLAQYLVSEGLALDVTPALEAEPAPMPAKRTRRKRTAKNAG